MLVNSDTGMPVFVDDRRLTIAEFEKVKIAETIETREGKSCRPIHSPLWQADPDKIRRMAPIEFIGRYMPGWFDYTICSDSVEHRDGKSAGFASVFNMSGGTAAIRTAFRTRVAPCRPM